MAQTGFTPIQLYFSSTTTNVPLAANLANGELAINITDGKLFYKDNANAVQVIGWKVTPTTAGGTGLTSYTAGDLPYYASGTTLSKLGIGASTTVITSSGSAPQWTAQSALSVGTASNLLSNATTGKMQIAGPGTGTTRVMTIPDANFTAARTDAGQTFTGNQIITLAGNDANIKVQNSGGGAAGAWYFADSVDLNYMGTVLQSAGVEKWFAGSYGTAAYQIKSGGRSGTEAFRVETTNDVKVSVGNLVIGTSGKGIDFSATPGTGTSELLADYEEGTWTPTFYGSGTAGTYTPSVYKASYTKVGRLVTVRADFTFSAASGGTGNVRLAGLPFSYSGQSAMPAVVSSAYVDTTTTSGLGLFVNQASSGTSAELYMYQCRDATTQEEVPISGISTNSRIAFVLLYEV
jgi:hypothetical protein